MSTPSPARRATLTDCEAVGRTLSDAFADDPVTSWMGRRDDKRDAGRTALFTQLARRIGVAGQELWVNDDCSAAALWMPPALVEQPNSLIDELLFIPTFVRFAGLSGLGRLSDFRKAADRHHPKSGPHFYLMSIGVVRARHGQGLGSALLKANLRRLDELNAHAYLESSSPKNIPLYQRHGFDVINEFRPRDDGPPLWGMWRAAR